MRKGLRRARPPSVLIFVGPETAIKSSAWGSLK